MLFIESPVRGYHVYRRVWEAFVGKELTCQREQGNLVDPFNHVGNFWIGFSSFDCFLFELYESKTCSKTSLNTVANGNTIWDAIKRQSQLTVSTRDMSSVSNLKCFSDWQRGLVRQTSAAERWAGNLRFWDERRTQGETGAMSRSKQNGYNWVHDNEF